MPTNGPESMTPHLSFTPNSKHLPVLVPASSVTLEQAWSPLLDRKALEENLSQLYWNWKNLDLTCYIYMWVLSRLSQSLEILKPMLGLMLFPEACSKIIRLRGTEDESREGTQRTSGLEHAKQNLAVCFAWCMPAAAAAKSLRSCPALCSPIDGSPPGSPFPGILQARTLEWVAVAFST